MATSIWDDFKKTLLDGVNVAAEKTEELTKIGKLKVEIINQNRTLDKTYKALGREIYVRISDGKTIDVRNDDGIKYFIDKINDVISAIVKNEKMIKSIRKESGEKSKSDVKKDEPGTQSKPEKGRKTSPQSAPSKTAGTRKKSTAAKVPVKKSASSKKPAVKKTAAKKPAAKKPAK